jgi:type I restriction enzyme S subunit
MRVGEWADLALGDVLTLQRGFDITKKEQRPGSVPVVSSSGIGSLHNDYKAPGPGVVIGRKGSLGTVFFIDQPFWPHDTTLWVKDFKGNDPFFCYLLLKTLRLEELDAGSSNPSLNRNHAHRLQVTCPQVGTQRRIAAVLSAFDELIEINERRIELLEDLARSIYREWFVNFRFPGHEDVQLVDFELGSIPKGWDVRKLKDVVTLEKGLSYKGAHLTDVGRPMANLKCLAPSGGFRRGGTKPYSGAFKPRHAVSPGDLIVANTDLTQAGHVIGSPAIVPARAFAGGGLISHHLFAVRPLDGSGTVPFLCQMLAHEAFRSFARGRASGTTVLGLRADDAVEFRFVAPPVALRSAFSAIAGALYEQAEALRDLNEDLAATRDLLLPRLVTGGLDISEIDLGVLTPTEAE